jgi:hypothetical protein
VYPLTLFDLGVLRPWHIVVSYVLVISIVAAGGAVAVGLFAMGS